MKRYRGFVLISLACAWAALLPARAEAAPRGNDATVLILSTANVAASAARAVSPKKAKPRKRLVKRATKRKVARSKRRAKPNHTAMQFRPCKSRKRSRRCRARSPLDDAYIPPPAGGSVALISPATAVPPPSEPIHDKPLELTPPRAKPDIVEREEDIPLIIQIATTLSGYRVEVALSIVETRDRGTGQISYRIVPGDEAMRTPDQAELPEVTLRDNERIVADIHSHPEIKARGSALQDKLIAKRATATNLYPGVSDFAAVEKREAVSAILNPNGTVFLLRRIAGGPSVRVVEGAPLPPLERGAAHRLDLAYLYRQGYLDEGAWTRPPAQPMEHATAGDTAETGIFVTPTP